MTNQSSNQDRKNAYCTGLHSIEDREDSEKPAVVQHGVTETVRFCKGSCIVRRKSPLCRNCVIYIYTATRVDASRLIVAAWLLWCQKDFTSNMDQTVSETQLQCTSDMSVLWNLLYRHRCYQG